MGQKNVKSQNMVNSGDAVANTNLKSIKIRHHHAKPYRKRHVTGLFVSVVCCALLVGAVVRYNKQLTSGLQTAKDFLVSDSNTQIAASKGIESSYGYSVTYDPRQLYASGLDSSTGELFIGAELDVARPYEVLRLAPTLGGVSADVSNMTIQYYPKLAADENNLQAVEAAALKDLTKTATLVPKKTETANVVIGGKKFIKSDWLFQSDNKVFAGLTPSFTTYSGSLQGKPLVMQIMYGAATNQNLVLYENVIASLYFGPTKVTTAPQAKQVSAALQKNRSLLESMVFGQIASAQATTSIPNSELISAQYSPAVVKIFNVYCQDILFDGKLIIKDACSGGSGSGFFINKDGYIASNGHVTSSDPKDILIQFAYTYFKKGDARLLDFLAAAAKVNVADLPNGTTADRADFLFNKLYDLNQSRVTTQNSATNLLVALGKDQPDLKELITVTNKRQAYTEQTTIKRATSIAQNFRSIDGFTKFHASDVSIIKIDGNNYPITKVGTIATLLQGANLNILGYPGNASNNGIVDAGQSTVTLTSGKVSAIKNALGSNNKLIETDTLIGHGNSGGPAFNDSGEVVGISTYTATKVDDGTYNYVRDISDLVSLASYASVVISTQSPTQTQWENALGEFNKAHYSKSLKGFAAVKLLYPSHPKVDEFIFAANQYILQGKDTKDFPVLAASIAGGVFFALSVTVVILIVRHKKAHLVYRVHVGEGAMEPLAKGDHAKRIHYNPDHIHAQKNVHTMTRHASVPRQLV